MISFYPGPSKLYPEVASWLQQAYKEGIMSVNHRSAEFVALSQDTISLLKEKLNIPADYSVFYTSSATECWEIITQSFIRKQSLHIYNGAFGEKWYEYSKKINLNSAGIDFNVEKLPEVKIKIFKETEVLCLTQNETSNGTQLNDTTINGFKERFPELLVAIDATSSMAGINLNFNSADIWFASVQKCFGLPAGMALLICSPKAMKRAFQINDRRRYNSILFMYDKMKEWQTPYTPNVLNIYLLNKVLRHISSIKGTHDMIVARSAEWYKFLSGAKRLSALISNPEVRSNTVISVKGDEGTISLIKEAVKKEGFILGNGYGKWARTTFRIANFPAHEEQDIVALKTLLLNYL
jgi:phosphoserine aminotransferase